MNVCFLTQSLHCGGAERWILSLARHMRQVRTVGILCLTDFYHPALLREAESLAEVKFPGSYRDRMYKEGYHTSWICTPKDVRIALRELRQQPDIIISWGVLGLAEFSHELGMPVVDVSHANGQWKAQKEIIQTSCLGATHLTAVSGAAKTAFPLELQNNVDVIFNGAEVDRVTPRIGRDKQREKWGIRPNEKLILFLGRFHTVKSPLRMAKAMHHLPVDYVPVFVGSGPDGELLAKFCEERFPGRHVIAPTELHVGDYYAAADCLVMPSKSEGFPLVMIEAWLARLPVVTTRHDFIDEIEKLHGPLFKVVPQKHKSKELAGVIQESLKKDGVVDKAFDIAFENYTASKMAQRWETYLTAVDNHWNRQALSGGRGIRHIG